MRLGVDYYPEHWEKERWQTDLDLMHRAGIEVVRIGEFDWSLYESEEDIYHFESCIRNALGDTAKVDDR